MRTDERHPRIAVKEGKLAPIVELHLDDGGWDGHYHFSTHGMSMSEIKAKHDAIVELHRAKAFRLTGFRSIDRTLPGGHTIADCTIRAQGENAVRLILRVLGADGSRIELDQLYATVADISSDEEIVAIARAAAQQRLAPPPLARMAAVKTALGL